MAATSTTRIRRALVLLIGFSISKCSSFASINVAKTLEFAPQHSTALSLSKSRVGPHVEPRRKHHHKKKHKVKIDYEQRKQEWLDRYGSVQALQSTFGSTKGDLSPEQTRRLYHTLLPRSLLGLYEMGLMKPEELAPLAYEARIAAKQYARSRCVWYARLATQVFDQYRNLRDRGRLGKSSMTWDEIWSKYEAQIVQEECTAVLNGTRKKMPKDLTMRIYLRILEKSTATNKAFDQMFLNSTAATNSSNTELDQLSQMGQQLDQDVRTILLGPKDSAKALKQAAKLEIRQAKAQVKVQEKEAKRQQKLEKKRKRELEKQQQVEEERLEKEQKRAEKRLKQLMKQQQRQEEQPVDLEEEEEEEDEEEEVDWRDTAASSSVTDSTRQRWQVLRILAGTRQKFKRLSKEGKLRKSEE